jgi:hypothetical protein
VLVVVSLAPVNAVADRLQVPSPIRDQGRILASYYLDRPASGSGTLQVIWTDGAGRLVIQQKLPVALHHEWFIAIPLDLGRAAVTQNRLQATLTLNGVRMPTQSADFWVNTTANPWNGYPIIIWQDQTPARAVGLRRLGIDATRVTGTRGSLTAARVRQQLDPVAAAGWSFYVENIATDFYATYHRYHPDHPVTWAFDQILALAAREPGNPRISQREPSLSDPDALAAIQARLAEHVALFGPYRPLYYNLADESGIADLAAAWDFDMGARSLAQMRLWLQRQYGSLAALNAQWDRNFQSWDDVVPMTTDQAIAGEGDNLSAWVDFKTWMDEAFARAIRAGTRAVHQADPTALAGIEGAQSPGWGGYDYSRLATAVDVMEIYDAGNNVEIAHALNPSLMTLTTTGSVSADERARLWHELFLGNHGLVVWDDANALVDDAGQPTALGGAEGRFFASLRDGVAAQLAAGRPDAGAVAILYSPSSFRVSWLLDRRQDGHDWKARGSEAEGQDTPMRAAMRAAASWLTHQGLQPRWISETGLENGALRQEVRVLVLPHVLALSPAAVDAIRAFVAKGGLVLRDVEPGRYDAHGRKRAELPLLNVGLPFPLSSPGWLRDVGGVVAETSLSTPLGQPVTDIDTRILRNGDVRMIGLQRDTDPTPEGEDVVVHLARPGQVYDLRHHVDLGWTDVIRLRIGAAEPVVLAVAPALLPVPVLYGPAAAHAGDVVALQIGLSASTPAAAHVLQVETRNPQGDVVAAYSGTVVVSASSNTEPVLWRVPLALNDPAGRWIIRVYDWLGSAAVTWGMSVAPSADQCSTLACDDSPG